MRKSILLTLLFAAIFSIVRADGGMWLPLFLNYNEAEMQSLGFKLTAEDVYSVNHHSMKDAVMLFGGGCTGELISSQGLVLTNHHCGYSYVQSHSTMEQNHLQNGFWAKDKSEEIPMKGLTVTFLVYMKDVTEQVLEDVNDDIEEAERAIMVKNSIEKVIKEATKGTHYKATIKPFYYGNQYFMFVTETYSDVRLVGVPPESIGKFGGDSDNWMWPRHTGDFSLWRIYTDKDGNPAQYSSDNIPMKPKKYFPISIKGIEENDFTLVFGYPGTTQQFLLSDGVDVVANVQNPIAIDARTIRLDAMKRQMNLDPRIRLMYSAKANSISNGWKKWQGESKGIRECNVIAKKQAQEADFQQWVNTTAERQKEYGNLLDDMHRVYARYSEHVNASTFINECIFGPEIISNVLHPYYRLLAYPAMQGENGIVENNREKLLQSNQSFRNSYCPAIDKEAFVELFTYYFTKEKKELIPAELHKYVLDEATVRQMMTDLWDKQATTAPYLTDNDKFTQFVKKAKPSQIAKTANSELAKIYRAVYDQYVQVRNQYSVEHSQLNGYYRTYVKALMEKDTARVFYPDANLTLRVTYGQVKGFEPADGVQYNYYTTLDGIIQKEDPDVYDYKVDPKLKQLWETKDYGRYANKNGELPVAFIASNHTTGGNSGSPVINANGELIGTNFDRVWEGTMSDINYDVSRCRNISLDARYFLFIVDKFANAHNLIEEMDIVE
ncbi:MAG: S46 family peptidase [Bacteroidales bacterium]|nr:S46 family peptidase [Bacteroidales bacterium]